MSYALAPLSWIYGGAVGARVWWFRSGWGRVHRLGRPVISVGNLSVGGTGKTPVVIAIGEALLARGVGVTVLSRGYRGEAERGGALVSDGRGGTTGSWQQAGDEPALIASRLPGAAVVVGRDRWSAWQRVSATLPPGVVILDDGFQHLAIAREDNLVLWDATERIDRAALLPRGRLREPLAALRRATAVLITRVEQAPPDAVAVVEETVRRWCPGAALLRVRFEPQSLIDVSTGRVEPVDRLSGRRVVVAAGIGRFESFVAVVTHCGAQVVDAIEFPDHHEYRDRDVDRVAGRVKESGAEMALVTEKDAVKLHGMIHPGSSWWALRVVPRITPEEAWSAMLDRAARAAAAA